ncbi:hypothetical protein E3N88_45797 [Mikania micrantha]|uniref:Leucine-rich repeat-containing N-terminal plant-type domain-containing protein n=1 Tax=Mikania micrantha TaxID=192012 RepID=A0A5N6L850_9ASTR|nr:hypothetical protein E3N88_45797 [Mikania micrantha]
MGLSPPDSALLTTTTRFLHRRFSGSALRPLPEYRALISVKTYISDDPQLSPSAWNLSTSHCTWSSATCDFKRHVIALDEFGGVCWRGRWIHEAVGDEVREHQCNLDIP